MKVVVIGAAGFIGSSLSDALLAAGHHVVGVDALIPESYAAEEKLRNIAAARASPNFEFHHLDVTDEPIGHLVEGADLVVNEAALPGLGSGWRGLDHYLRTNVLAVQRVVDAVTPVGCRLVHISTSSVYGAFATGDERTVAAPISAYGVSKLAGEQLALAHARTSGLDVVVLRYFSVYGPRQRPDMAYRIFSESLLDGREIVVHGDGLQRRTNTHISDCVAGTLLAAERGESATVYNLGGGESVTVLRAIEILADELGVRPSVRHVEPREGDQRDTAAVVDRIAALGYHPTVGIEAGLRGLARWCAERRDG